MKNFKEFLMILCMSFVTTGIVEFVITGNTNILKIITYFIGVTIGVSAYKYFKK